MSSRRPETGRSRTEYGATVPLTIAAALLLSFVYLVLKVTAGSTETFDRAILQVLRIDSDQADPIGPALLEEIGRDITALGSYSILVIVSVVAVGYFLLTRRWAAVILLATTTIGGTVLNTVLKHAFDRPRPDVIGHSVPVFSPSFPSAHSTLASVVFLTVGALLARTHHERHIKVYILAVAIILTAFVGLSRVYLGVHYPTDVIAGWAVGAAWAILCWTLYLWYQQRIQTRDTIGSARSHSGRHAR